MNNLKKYYFIFFVLITAGVLPAQKKKEVKSLGIKTVTTIALRNGKTTLDKKVTYEKHGEVSEEINYDKEGHLESTTKYKYDKKGELLEETEYNEKNVIKEKRTYKYDLTGHKTQELVADKDGKVIKKSVYTLNNFGLKIEKKVYDGNNVLQFTKKYVYSYGNAIDDDDDD